MQYSLCADTLFVKVGEKGPIWPDTNDIIISMKLAKKNHLSGIEFFSMKNRDLKKIMSAGNELGIKINAAVSEGGSFLGQLGKNDEIKKGFLDSIEDAKIIDCHNLIFNAEKYSRDIPHEAVTELIIDMLKELAPIAHENNISILVEPLTDGFFKSSQEAFDIIRRVDSNNVKLLYDIFHFQNIEGKISETIKENLPLIGDIHGAGSPMRGELTNGELNYGYLITFLNKLNYNGNFCLEFLAFEDRENKVAASCSMLV